MVSGSEGKSLNHLQQYLVDEFVEEYHEGKMSRRDLLRRVLGITGGVAATATLLLSMGCGPQPTTPATATVGTTGGATGGTSAGAAPSATSAPKTTSAPAGQTPTQANAQATIAASPSAMTTSATKPAGQTPTAGTTGTAGATGTARPAASASPSGTPGTGGASTPQPTFGPRSKLTVPANDTTITASDITIPGDGVQVMVYQAVPKSGGPFRAVLVCHENRGLTEHIRDVTRRLAKAGYLGLAVDLLSRDGGTAKADPGAVPGKLTANPSQNVADFVAAYRYLAAQSNVAKSKDGKPAIGMVGFCFGGGMTWLTAVAIADLKAAVPFYGPIPPVEDFKKINAAVLAIYGEADQRITSQAATAEEEMRKAGKTFEKIIYPGANHAFHNDTGGSYNEAAAEEAWKKTLDWMARYLA